MNEQRTTKHSGLARLSLLRPGERVPGDWYIGRIPTNIETAYAFRQFTCRRNPGFVMGAHAAAYRGCTFVVGEQGFVSVGDYSLLNRVLIAWSVGIFDSHGLPRQAEGRAAAVQAARTDPFGTLPAACRAQPVIIEDDVWIGFGAVILPGVRIGERSVIGAQSVVTRSVPPDVIVAENPAQVIRPLRDEEMLEGSRKS